MNTSTRTRAHPKPDDWTTRARRNVHVQKLHRTRACYALLNAYRQPRGLKPVDHKQRTVNEDEQDKITSTQGSQRLLIYSTCTGSYVRARPHIPRYPSGQRTSWAPSTLAPAAGGGLCRTLARARRLRGTQIVSDESERMQSTFLFHARLLRCCSSSALSQARRHRQSNVWCRAMRVSALRRSLQSTGTPPPSAPQPHHSLWRCCP